MLSNIFSVVAPISVDNVDLVKLWSNIVPHLIRIQSFDNKNFLNSSLRTRKVSKVSISLRDFREHHYYRLYSFLWSLRASSVPCIYLFLWSLPYQGMRLASQRWLIFVFRDVYSITHTSRILPVFPFVSQDRKFLLK